ncbi:hypothetical protein OQA88_13266 [Cercophora sp. LCS_1]
MSPPPVLRSRSRSRSRTRSRSRERRSLERAEARLYREHREHREAQEAQRLREAQKLLEQKRAWGAYREALPWIVDVANLDWEHYHNRYGEGEGRHIIEVLNVSSSIEEEWDRENFREHLQKTTGSVARDGYTPEPVKYEPWPLTGIQRIRVQSPGIIAQLCKAAKIDKLDVDIPHTFLRPFHTLGYIQPKMRELLDALKASKRAKDMIDLSDKNGLGGTLDTRTEQSNSSNVDSGVDKDSDSDSDTSVASSVGTEHSELDAGPLLEHLQCYVDFVDKEVMPLHSAYEGTSLKKIRFNDLGLLFRPGEIVYRSPLGSINNVPYALYQPVWRVFHCKRAANSSKPDDISLDYRDGFQICCLYFDYDGKSYGTIKTKINIGCFQGEKEITDLPAYPLRYAAGAERLRQDLTLQGQTFESFLKEHHLFYDGWSIPGELQEDEDDEEGRDRHRDSLIRYIPRINRISHTVVERKRGAPEHVEGPVVLDFDEAFNHFPRWKPKFRKPRLREKTKRWEFKTGDKAISHWSDTSRSQLSFQMRELILLKEDTMRSEKRKFLRSPDMARFFSSDPVEEIVHGNKDDIMLLPRRVVAYSLRDRSFFNLDVHSLKMLERHADIFQDLKINPDHQRIIQSLVTAHFEGRLMQKEKPFLSLGQDLVYGKGSGLFILLHGVPGVGKTATAEAVAQHFRKPLFSITCGNLGLDPSSVEAELKEIFRLAHLWDCVLLLDEADVFLARRDISSLKRNALVSVFLRVLEYYSGILFLTTNRVGTIDEAFKSRIHLSLYYERLTKRQMEAIFKVNIRRLRTIEEQKAEQLRNTSLEEQPLDIREDDILDFAMEHWESTRENASRRWNGRQIRNAFQIASSLARYDRGSEYIDEAESPSDNNSGGKNQKPVLDGEQFRLVSDAIKRFNQYFEQATGQSDELSALLEGLRDDNARNKDLAPSAPPKERRGSRSGRDRYDDRRSEKDRYDDRRKERRSDYSDKRHNDDYEDYDDHQRHGSGKSRRDRDKDREHHSSYSEWPRETERDRDRDRDRDTGSHSGGKRSIAKGRPSDVRALSPPRTPSDGSRRFAPATTSSSKRLSRSPKDSSRYGKEKTGRSDRRHHDRQSEGEDSASYSDRRRRDSRNRISGGEGGRDRRGRYAEDDEF